MIKFLHIFCCVALFAMLSVGCSDEKKETQNLPQTEQSAPPQRGSL